MYKRGGRGWYVYLQVEEVEDKEMGDGGYNV
jgi:hypothetical protein